MRKHKYKAPDRGDGSRAKEQQKADWFANDTAYLLLPQPVRSAANWLLDSATYARDGDVENARVAAQRGLTILTGAAV